MRKPLPFGPWLLLERLAVGGMAEVFLAIRAGERPPRLHALKRMLTTLADDPELVMLFLDEARVWAQLCHPSIPPLRELGREDGICYIAYDYLPGKDLRVVLERLRSGGARLPIAVAAHIAARAADALDHAHRRRGALGRPLRVVHNDVSPANLLLGYDGSVRIIDFGIARAEVRARADLTPAPGAALRGKLAYLSPEAVRGQRVDRRADVFSLGAVLHEMLTGERLFSARSELASLAEVRNAEVRPPSLVRPEIPRGLDALVLRALSREREQRFRWASELREELHPFAGGEGPHALARLMARTFPDDLRAELSRPGLVAGSWLGGDR
ncbi:MAG TPA: serine/threonine-protein kinase [Anaeromyxobacter sp.]|nr:serine/threonine-protein kinase [Anaeromyxobacter sp.]